MEKLTPLADGVTMVPMKKELSIVTLDVISKVSWEWEGLACETIISYSTGFLLRLGMGLV